MKRCLAWLSLVVAADGATQTYQGGVRGAVHDASGVIPGAVITLTNEGTNQKRTSTSNDRGQYAFPNVPPGDYTVSATVDGFRPFARAGIEVGVQRFVILDIVLEIGTVEETLTVTGESPVLETATASNASSLEAVEMVTLPTPSRNPFFLAITTPNVVPSGNPQFQRMQDQNATSALSIAGGPRRGNNYTLDGVSITDLRNRAVIIPSMESLEEVKVQVSTYDAEMGRTGGGVFNTFHRRGSNQWHGSALIQNRPAWGIGQLYFDEQAGAPKPDSYYWLWGGSFGGAIVPDKTFFWVSTEGYRTSVTRNRVLTLPTQAMARGDFSGSDRTIYDPLTTRPDPNNPGGFIRDPFPENVIPPDRLNPVGVNIASFLTARGQGDISATANVVDAADQFSVNITHEFNPSLTLSGTYMYYDSDEPGPLFIDNPYDPALGNLFRQVNLFSLNTTYIPGGDSVLTLRYGYFRFVDDFAVPEFDIASLGFSDNFVAQTSQNVFPFVDFPLDYPFGGAGATDQSHHYSHSVNGTWSKFIGNHTLKVGGDYRRLGLDFLAAGAAAGAFEFGLDFTQGPDPTNPAPDSGDGLATLVLGYPTFGVLETRTPQERYIDYVSAFIHDDWRVSSSLVLNLGLRIEHEQGLKEKSDILTVGFDRETPWPVQPIDGITLRGGLLYAGKDGGQRHLGDPTPIKLGPRVGASFSAGPSTVIRGGYGLFWAPPQPFGVDARGYDASTFYLASTDGGLTPAGSLADPFPKGTEQPIGNALGLLTGAGGDIEFPDQFRKSPYVQQFSIDVQHELGPSVVVSAGYLGSRADQLGLNGSLNINQLDPSFQSMGSALLDEVPNPFFGIPVLGNLSQSETIPRGQLLRPYPQFGNLFAAQVSDGKRRYHSFVARLEKRFRGGWGARANYTFSRTDDNVYGEGNFFSGRFPAPLDSTDADAEYGRSLTDTPHRLNLSGLVELPFGAGKRWLDDDGVWSQMLGGWTVSATGYYQSGFPLAVTQVPFNTGVFSEFQRPNVVPGVDPGHTGSTTDNLDTYLNPDAWELAPAFTFGDAPRTDTRVRSPFRKNWDVAFQKTASVGSVRTSFRLEIINLFDTPDFRRVNGVFGTGNFGRITDVSGFARTFQLTFRFDW